MTSTEDCEMNSPELCHRQLQHYYTLREILMPNMTIEPIGRRRQRIECSFQLAMNTNGVIGSGMDATNS